MKTLFIVESPAKAKTLQKYLKKCFKGRDLTVAASYGHIRDLPEKELAVDVQNGFQPKYEIPKEKRKVVAQLRKLAKEAKEVWLATDADREGEAISWHLTQVLNLSPDLVKRIVFHEITQQAIEEAVAAPRSIDMDLVHAQQARRILDRLVGYELSPLLWRKLKQGLSAGRVQSVAVRLIVEREREILSFQPQSYFSAKAQFRFQQETFSAKIKERLNEEQLKQLLQLLQQTTEFHILEVEQKRSTRRPPAPFITSTLQQEAAQRLGFPVSLTMRLAQQLYEEGYITYMRTDSVHLSEQAHQQIKKVIYKQYGKKYYERRDYQVKSRLAQEAHEAIRPTDMTRTQVPLSQQAQKLYTLIWRRTIASQMAAAQIDKTIVTITYPNAPFPFIAEGEIIRFDGFLKVYPIEQKEDILLPPLKKGDKVTLEQFQARQQYTKPPARYSEGTLVRKLEQLGIGRPSTYAPIIATIQQRGYVVKESREGKKRNVKIYLFSPKEGVQVKQEEETFGTERNKLFPTNLGMIVTDFLMEFFPDIMDYHFTAQVEEQFDKIAQGQLQWQRMLQAFYTPFHEKVEQVIREAARRKVAILLGTDPRSQKPVYACYGRFGAYLRLGEEDDPQKRTISLPKQWNIESISLEEALFLLSLPIKLGNYQDQPITLHWGRYGFYLKHGDKTYPFPKNKNPLNFSLQDAQTWIEQQQAAKNNVIKTFEEEGIAILKGRYGPYIRYQNRNIAIPKGKDPQSLSLQECKSLIAAAKQKKRRR